MHNKWHFYDGNQLTILQIIMDIVILFLKFAYGSGAAAITSGRS
jgi:hypothetical protein